MISKNKTDYKVSVVGAGYIGSVLAAVLSDNGANVTAIDINPKVIELINKGISPIEEPGLEELIQKMFMRKD